MPSSKLITFADLPKNIAFIKKSGQPTVLVGGCFDILHLGHVRFLNVAKKYGTLVVALESDTNVRRYKGQQRPIHLQKERAEALAALTDVDYIITLPNLTSDKEYANLTQLISPNVIALTQGDPQLKNKSLQAKMVGAQVKIIPKIITPSTSQLAKLLDLE